MAHPLARPRVGTSWTSNAETFAISTCLTRQLNCSLGRPISWPLNVDALGAFVVDKGVVGNDLVLEILGEKKI